MCWSGGLDSTILIAYQIILGHEVYPLFVRRGQRNYQYEKQSVDYFTKLWDLPTKEIAFSYPPEGITVNDNLVDKMGHPMRNSTLANIAVYYAVMNGLNKVFTGSNFSDTYPDSSLSFWRKKQNEVRQAINDETFVVTAPFQELKWTKADIIAYALKNNIPYEKTRSCYQDSEVPCGKCRACRHRRKSELSALRREKE